MTLPLPVLLESAAFVLGLLFGSFLNVCITRLAADPPESVVSPRSHCRSCGSTLRWYDNLPLLSYLALRARCRQCHKAIPFRYPLVELALALWWALAAHRLAPVFLAPGIPVDTLLGASVNAVGFAALGFFLLGLLVIDWQQQLLPDLLTIPGILTGFFVVALQAMLLPSGQGAILLHARSQLNSPAASMARGNLFLTGAEALLFGRLLAVLAAAGLLLLLRWVYFLVRRREGLGLGDIKLVALLAAFLGLAPTLLAVFTGVTAGALWAVVLLARRRAGRTTRLPLGTFLCAGGLLAALYGEQILRWYRSLL